MFKLLESTIAPKFDAPDDALHITVFVSDYQARRLERIRRVLKRRPTSSRARKARPRADGRFRTALTSPPSFTFSEQI